jgi:hypothetical protein
MRETVTVNRIICCSLLNKEVAQQISAYANEDKDNHTSELLTKYCSGEQWCHSQDCQFITGLSGKSYSKPLSTIYRVLEA